MLDIISNMTNEMLWGYTIITTIIFCIIVVLIKDNIILGIKASIYNGIDIYKLKQKHGKLMFVARTLLIALITVLLGIITMWVCVIIKTLMY